MFLIGVLSFITGIYIQAIYAPPLRLSAVLLLCCMAPALFFIRKRCIPALFLAFACFMLAGMLRLGMAGITYHLPAIGEEKDVYEGLVIETGQNTKIIRILKPADAKGIKAVFRTPDSLNINDRVRIFGQLREMNLTFKNPYLTTWKWMKSKEGIAYEVRGALISVSPGKNYIEAWRRFLQQRIDAAGAKYSGVIKALTIGDTTGIDEATKALFLRTGTSHILAISGSNIGIITAFFFFLARVLIRRSPVMRLRGDDTKYASLLSIPFAFMFMLTAGSSIPTIRATIMITVYMLSLVFERGRHAVNTIALSALIILIIYPHSLFMPTFQLTFTSVLFLAIFAEKFYPLIDIRVKTVKWLLSTILMTVSAILGTLPIVIYHFYGINPFSVIHNLIAVPLMCILAMPMSLAGMVLPYGEYLLRLSGEVINLAVYGLTCLDAGYVYPIIRPGLFEIALYFACILSLVYIKTRLVLACLIFIVLPVSVINAYVAYEKRFGNSMSINFLDVGLGEAILVEAPQGKRILIDGGGFYVGDFDIGKSVITPILLSKKILTLDYVINTHPHGDHIGGLLYITKTFNVRSLAVSGYFMNDPRFMELLNMAREKHINVRIWKKGDRIPLADDTEMIVMNPRPSFSSENPNNASLVLKLTHRHTSFLLTGDIESDIEEKLILSDTPLKSTVMKIPHHGSRHSSSTAFLRAVRPSLAVLSVGRGIKGVPSDETIERYKRLSIPVVRTDVNGFISIKTDGDGITYTSFQQ